jgi:hypothetical protein
MRFSHFTGWVLALLGAGVLVFVMWNSPTFHLLLWPPLAALFVLNEWLLRRRKKTYLSAMATVEGGGIKRGLTAPQAAALLELPLGKVIALVVFGLLKKGVLRVVKEQPLTVEVAEPYRKTRRDREKRAAANGIVIHSYEHPFIDRLLIRSDPVAKIDLSDPLTGLLKVTASRMRGFDLSDTQDYYRRIVARAWGEAEQIGEIEQRTETVDRNVDWMMLDPDWSGRFGRWTGGGYHYYPWWARSGATPSAASSASPAVPSPAAPSGSSRTSLGEVAASFAGWTENTADSLVGTIEPAKLGLVPQSGILDLSGVDKMTADVFEAMSKSSGSGGGGGGGGGCACACAGCACACACAGGGR